MKDKFADENVLYNLVPWSDAEFPATAEYLANSQVALDLYRKVGQAKDKRVPYTGTNTSGFDRQYDSMLLFPASAAKKVSLGDYEGAYADLDALVDYWAVYTHGAGMHFVLGIGGEMFASRYMGNIALLNEVPADVALKTIRHLETMEVGPGQLQEMFRKESLLSPTMVDAFLNPKGSILFYDLPGWLKKRPQLFMLLTASSRWQMQRDMDAFFGNIVFMAGQPYDHARLTKFEDQLNPYLSRSQVLVKTADPPGYVAAGMYAPFVSAVITNCYRTTASLRMTELVLAVRQFQQSEKRLPSDLNELIPKYLASVPLDPFDSKPLRYKVKQDGSWIIYSVDKNQVDDGGTKGLDLIFSSTAPADELEQVKKSRKKK
ncbi:MAG TPA: hypothetical protein VG733_02165 [Chthoniobacteraceae bacterium]|nr:hypothetical protein [Chthoniobacteraceae bacterium]